MANALRRHVDSVSVYSSAPRRYFRGLADGVTVRMVPAPVEILGQLTAFDPPPSWYQHDIVLWDRLVSAFMGKSDVVIGFASQSLETGRSTKRRGSRFVLDRACPHVDFQQGLMREETARVGAKFSEAPDWFNERQLEEYELADLIVTPSRYTAETFPAHLRSKIVRAPLLGRTRSAPEVNLKRNEVFTVGVVGGMPLRKGYLYLFEAWKKLALPNAKLRIRSAGDFSMYPALTKLLKELPNVEIVGYVPDMADFYRSCDLFVLPSVDDGFGMALLEAMANGIPTISTRNCGASEMVRNGEEGLVIDARSVDQLVDAIQRLYDDELLRQALAVGGKARAESATRHALYEDALWGSLNAFSECSRQVAGAVA